MFDGFVNTGPSTTVKGHTHVFPKALGTIVQFGLHPAAAVGNWFPFQKTRKILFEFHVNNLTPDATVRLSIIPT